MASGNSAICRTGSFWMSTGIILLTVTLHSLACGEDDSDARVPRIQQAWHQWRGPLANGEAPNANPPLRWSDDTNIAWRASVPGRGSTTPILWEDRVFLLTSIDTGRIDPDLPKPEDQPRRPFGITYPNTFYQFVVLCYDRQTGDELWRQIATERIPHEGHHGDNNYASASPTTDGQRLYCWFGSQGLYCYSLDGELIWQKDLGPVSTRRSFGEGASPVVHDGKLVLNRDQEGQSYLVVLDASSGDELWRAERDELTTWNTPLVTHAAGRTQVVVSATNRVRSYDLDSGELIWECGGQVTNVVPSPVRFRDHVICMSGYRGSIAVSIPLAAQGDITGTSQVAWTLNQGTPYVPSPLLVGHRLYFNQSNNAIISCVDAESGEVLIERTRLPELRSLYASPVAAAGRLYLTGRDGETVVLKVADRLERLAVNRLNDALDASAAIVGDSLYLRGRTTLYCVRDAAASAN